MLNVASTPSSRSLLLLLLLLLLTGAASAQTSSSFSSVNDPRNVNGGGSFWLEVFVQGVGAITEIEVQFDAGAACTGSAGNAAAAITHSRIGDLTLTLESPSGSQVVLMQRRGGERDNVCSARFDDDPSLPPIASLTSVNGQAVMGAFRPDAALSTFVGEHPNGMWLLRVANDGVQVATLRAVTLTLRTAPVPDILVDRLDDPTPNGCVPGSCSLREAITLANVRPGLDRIVLPAGTLQLTRIGIETNNASGDLNISETLELVGQGAELTTLEQTVPDRIMSSSDALFLRRMRMQGGAAPSDSGGGAVLGRLQLVEDMVFANNRGSSGGAIASFAATPLPLIVRRTRFDDNVSESSGGALRHQAANGLARDMMQIEDSDFVNNRAERDGGALLLLQGALFADALHSSVSRTRFVNNQVLQAGSGGAIALVAGDEPQNELFILDSQFLDNAVPIGNGQNFGGAIAATGGTVRIERSDFVGNSARFGGALYAEDATGAPATTTVIFSTLCDNRATLLGGGIYHAGTLLNVRNSTLCDNSVSAAIGNIAPNGGGAIAFDGVSLQVTRSTLHDNKAVLGATISLIGGDLSVRNSTLSVPTFAIGSDGSLLHYLETDSSESFAMHNNLLLGRCRYADANQAPDFAFNNIEASGDTCRLAPANGNLVNRTVTSVGLGVLADNGGPTLTRMPSTASIALNAANQVYCTALDQRGYVSNDNDCDIGAVERGAAAPTQNLFSNSFEN